jgi:hypothetical protein
LSGAALALVGLALFALLHWPAQPALYRNYERVENGMTMEQVQALLGPGREIGKDDMPSVVRPAPGVKVPKDPPGGPYRTVRDYPIVHAPVVEGDRFFEWPSDWPPLSGGPYIIIGFRGGKVCDKWYWEPSL